MRIPDISYHQNSVAFQQLIRQRHTLPVRLSHLRTKQGMQEPLFSLSRLYPESVTVKIDLIGPALIPIRILAELNFQLNFRLVCVRAEWAAPPKVTEGPRLVSMRPLPA